jgi:LemA protein
VIVITKQGDTYICPQGEHFNHFPTVYELEALYNGGTISPPSQGVPNAVSPDMGEAVAKERMLRAQLQASADEEQKRIDEANKQLEERIAKSNQEMAAQQNALQQENSQNQTKVNSTGGGFMGALFFLIVLLGILIYWGTDKYNNLVQARETVRNALNQISVLLKRRHDLIPNLVEATKGYMGYERETLEKVTKARQTAVNAVNVPEKAQTENILTSSLRGFWALAENYPNLKADQSVLQLQSALTDTENKISVARQQYNNEVKQLNIFIQSFPDSIVAAIGHFEKAPFFQGEKAEEEKQAPQVNLKQC